MTISITASELRRLLPEFSEDACKVIVDYCEETSWSPRLGDVREYFCEIEAEDIHEEDPDMIICQLKGGRYLIHR